MAEQIADPQPSDGLLTRELGLTEQQYERCCELARELVEEPAFQEAVHLGVVALAAPVTDRDTAWAMSEENMELALQQVEAVNRRDPDAFVATVSPDVEWEDDLFGSEVPRSYRGRAEVREWFGQVVEPWESLDCEVEEITEVADDRLFVGGLLTGRGKGSGVDTELRFWAITWIADGKVTQRKAFRDRAKALKAAGPRRPRRSS